LSKLKKKIPLNIKYVEERPGHDKKYASSNKKILKIGWKPNKNFNHCLKKTILFYLNVPKIFKDNKIHFKRYGII
jgi:dTDP-glucose 4,6-dehydratase